MAVNIQGEGALEWDASINVEGLINGQKIIEQGLDQIYNKSIEGNKTLETALQKYVQGQENVVAASVRTADEIYQAWRTRATQIVEMAREAGTQAGELFEFKETNIGGVQSSTFYTTDQIRNMEVALTLLDGALTVQEQQQKLGLSELDFLRAKQQVLAELQQQLDKESEARLSQLEQIKAAEDDIARSRAAGTVNVGISSTGPTVEQIIGEDFKQILDDAGMAFDDLDKRTQSFVRNLIELELQYAKLGAAQKELDAARESGKISQQEYERATANIAALEKQMQSDIDLLTKSQKEYELSVGRTVGSIDAKKAALKDLQRVYGQLNEEERNSLRGQEMLKQIGDLKLEIKSLDPAKLSQTAGRVASVRTEITRLQNLMAQNPDSPMFDQWRRDAAELTLRMKAVKESVDQATNSTAGVSAFAEGLRGLVGAFTATAGAIGLFTTNQEDMDRVTKNAASALALLNGVQEVSNVLSKNSALNVFLLGLARKKQAADTALSTTATVANTAVQGANAAATTAVGAASTAAAGGVRALTAAMLANPAGLLVTAVAALTVGYLALRDGASAAAMAEKRAAEEAKGVAEGLAEQQSKIDPLIEAVKRGNLTHNEQVNIYEQLKKINPDLVAGMDAQSLSYEKLSSRAKAYLLTLENQLRMEIKQNALRDLLVKREAALQGLQKAKDLSQSLPSSSGQALVERFERTLQNVNKEIDDVKEGITGLLDADTVSEPAEGRLAYIDKEIARVKKLQATYSSTSEEYAKYGAIIKYWEGEREKIAPKTIASTKAKSNAEREYNALLNEQANLLQMIEGLKRDSSQSGLLKEQSELDKINEKYDLAIKKIEEFNSKAPEGLRIDTAPVQEARETEIENTKYRRDAELYIESLDTKRKAFEAFENAKQEFGERKARELFQAQVGETKDYAEFLREEIAKLEQSPVKLNFGEQLKLQGLRKAAAAEDERIAKATLDATIEGYRKLLQATITYQERRKAINDKYDQLERDAQADASVPPEIISQRLETLARLREEEIDGVNRMAVEQSEIYKQMNEEIYGWTQDRIKREIARVQQILNAGVTVDREGSLISIPPDVLKQLDEYLKKLRDAGKAVSNQKADWDKIAQKAGQMGGPLRGLASAIRPFNESIADSVDLMSDFSSMASDAAGSIASFASGDIVNGITSGISAIGGLLGVFGKAREERRRRDEEEKRRQAEIFLGEFAVNELYRERYRQQVLLNKLRLQGIRDEMALLQQQTTQVAGDYATVFAALQQETIRYTQAELDAIRAAAGGGVAGMVAANNAAISGISLAGKTFEELERLFLEGRLEGAALQLFQQLQLLKQEGVDIESQMLANAQAYKELLTGTTADSMLDSMVQGFAEGKRAAGDFADDFEELMRGAILNAFKYQALEEPLKAFYEQFAGLAEDGLTEADIDRLREQYNAIIRAAGETFDQLEDITDVNLTAGAQGGGGGLQGAIKGITQQQADLLAGQFGGLRMTAFEHVAVARQQLTTLNLIANNTSVLGEMARIWYDIHINGVRVR